MPSRERIGLRVRTPRSSTSVAEDAENDRRKKTGPRAGFFQLMLRLTGLRPKPEQPTLPEQPTQQLHRLQQQLPTKQQPTRRSQHQQLPKQPTKRRPKRRLQPTKQIGQRSCCKQPVQQRPTGKLRGGISS
jgi:hypothetical protein